MHLIMFDIDGTLVDSNHFDDALFARSIQNVLGISINGNWQQFTHATYSGILNQIIADNNFDLPAQEILQKVKKHFIQQTEQYLETHGLKEVPGAGQFIASLQSKENVIPAIATGGWDETAKLKLQKVGLDSAECAYASCSDAESRTKIMQVAEQRALKGITPKQKIYFGDGPWDKIASSKLNYRFVGVGDGVHHSLTIQDYRHPEKIISKLNI